MTPALNYRWLLPVLLIATWLRFHNLDAVPPGMTHDEGSIGFFVQQIASGARFRIDVPYGFANEPLTKYVAAPLFLLLGATDWTLRAHQAYWGIVGVAFAFAWGRIAFNARVGLSAAALMAVGYWPLTTSRMALNSNPLPALIAGAAFFLWKSQYRRKRRAWLGFALLLGAALLTYEASRTTWFAFLALLLYLVLIRGRRRETFDVKRYALALTAGTALAGPYLLSAAAWGRTGTLAEPLRAATAGDFAPLLSNVLAGLETLGIRGDPFVVYNLPERPVFGALLFGLFIIGVVVCILRWKQPANAFALLWLGAGFAPTLIIGAFTSALHSIGAQAVILTLPAVGVDALAARNRKLTRVIWIGFVALLAWTGVRAGRDYFGAWAGSPVTRAAYFANFGAVTRYIDELPPGTNVTLSSAFPDRPHDPFVYDLRVRDSSKSVRWFDARNALVFPQTNRSALIAPVHAYPHPYIAGRLPLARAERSIVRPDDIDPWFDVLDWNPAATLADWLADPSVVQLDDDGYNFSVAHNPVVSLDAYAQQVEAGELIIATFWNIFDPAAIGQRATTEFAVHAKIFVHLLGADGSVISQMDRLDAPVWNWRAGDHFVQLHRLPLSADIPPGIYTVRIGLYTLPDVKNLRLPNGGEFALLPVTLFGK